MDRLEEVSARAAIERLKARYCRYVDLKRWDRLVTLFTPDAEFDGFYRALQDSSPADFVRGIAQRLEDAITVHHCHMPDIEFESETSARGVWAMTDFNEWPRPTRFDALQDVYGIVGYGFYEEKYRFENGTWLISFMRLTRVRIDPVLKTGRPEGFDPFVLSPGLRRPSPGWVTDELCDHDKSEGANA